jgi:hypothetical protein
MPVDCCFSFINESTKQNPLLPLDFCSTMAESKDDKMMPPPPPANALFQSRDGNDEEEIVDAVVSVESSPQQQEEGYDTADDEDANHHNDNDIKDVEPDDSKVNSLRFASCCVKLERIWRNKLEKQASRRMKEKERLELLLPKAMIQSLNGQTIYPYVRLLIPEQDSHRQYAMQDKKLAEMYCTALGFAKKTTNYEMMYHYQDPSKVPQGCAGDLSLVVEHILKKRIPTDYSSVTIGKINELLDEMNNLRANSNRGRAHHNHQWRESQSQHETMSTKETKRPTLTQLRSKWIQKVMNKRLSPLEHKWLVRILLKRMRNSVGYVRLLHWISPYAQAPKGMCHYCGSILCYATTRTG